MGSSRSGWLVGKGSGVITSKPAAHSLLSFRAEYRASWSTTPTNQTKYCNTLLPNPFKFILKAINYLSCNTIHVVLCYSREDQQPWRIGCKTLNKKSSLFWFNSSKPIESSHRIHHWVTFSTRLIKPVLNYKMFATKHRVYAERLQFPQTTDKKTYIQTGHSFLTLCTDQ